MKANESPTPEISPQEFEVTKKDLEFFIKHARYWQKRLALSGWNIYYAQDGSTGFEACMTADSPSRTATILLADSWSVEVTKKELAMAAFHEIAELLLHRLDEMARYSVSDTCVNEPRHEIIRILEAEIFDPWWEKSGHLKLRRSNGKL